MLIRNVFYNIRKSTVTKVTVLMPIYNTQEEILRATIDGILEQTFTDFEFLIINDSSTNNVEDVVLSYQDPRIVYIKNPKNMGISESSNLGLKLSKGEYIARQDHDDISEPNRLATQVKFMDENTDYGVCSSFFTVFPKTMKAEMPVNDEDIKISLVLSGAAICHPASMLRKKVLVDNNIEYKDEYRYAEDYQLWVDLLNKTKFHNLPLYLFRYRWFGGNTSFTSSERQAVSALGVKLNAVKEVIPELSPEQLDVVKRSYKKERMQGAEILSLLEYFNQAQQKTTENWKKITISKLAEKMLKHTVFSKRQLSLLWKLPVLQISAWAKLKLWLKSFTPSC